MSLTEVDTFVRKFHQLWRAGLNAHLDLDCHAGVAWVGLRAQLGQAPGPVHHQVYPTQNQSHRKSLSPSYHRRRERRARNNENKENAEEASTVNIQEVPCKNTEEGSTENTEKVSAENAEEASIVNAKETSTKNAEEASTVRNIDTTDNVAGEAVEEIRNRDDHVDEETVEHAANPNNIENDRIHVEKKKLRRKTVM